MGCARRPAWFSASRTAGTASRGSRSAARGRGRARGSNATAVPRRETRDGGMDRRARRSAIFSDAYPQPPWLAINVSTNRDSERGQNLRFFSILLVLARFFQTATPIRFVMSIFWVIFAFFFKEATLFSLLSPENRSEKLKRAAPWRAHSKSRGRCWLCRWAVGPTGPRGARAAARAGARVRSRAGPMDAPPGPSCAWCS